MNKWDSDNLKFIMSLSSTEFDNWYETLSDEDLKYAMELLAKARVETAEQLVALSDEVTSLAKARKVLSKYTLVGKVTVK